MTRRAGRRRRGSTDTTGTFQSSRVYSDAPVYHPSHTSRSALWIAVLVALDMVNWTFYGWWKEIFYSYYWCYRPPLFMSLVQTFEVQLCLSHGGQAPGGGGGQSGLVFAPPSLLCHCRGAGQRPRGPRHQDAGTTSCQ